MRRTQRRYPFTVDAMVILPDHIHAVWTLPEGDADFSSRWRLIKVQFTKAVPKTEPRSEVRMARGERAIWQRRFREHLIRDDEDFRRHVEYCYINPVKHRLVDHVSDWPYSSFHRDVRANLFRLIGVAILKPMEVSVSVFVVERRNARSRSRGSLQLRPTLGISDHPSVAHIRSRANSQGGWNG